MGFLSPFLFHTSMCVKVGVVSWLLEDSTLLFTKGDLCDLWNQMQFFPF